MRDALTAASSSGGLPVEWHRYPELDLGEFVEVRFKADTYFRGTVFRYQKGGPITLDRGEALGGNLQINEFLGIRRIGLLERIAEEVAEAERQEPQ